VSKYDADRGSPVSRRHHTGYLFKNRGIRKGVCWVDMRPTILRALIAMMLAGIVVFGAAMGVSAQTQTLATFEAGHSFEASDHVISLVASTDWASQGSRSLRVNHGPIPAGSRFVVRVAQDLNWVGATHVLADFYVPENAPHSYSAALMIQVGDGWTWYETNPVPLSPGENKDVAFRLDTAEWRTRPPAGSREPPRR